MSATKDIEKLKAALSEAIFKSRAQGATDDEIVSALAKSCTAGQLTALWKAEVMGDRSTVEGAIQGALLRGPDLRRNAQIVTKESGAVRLSQGAGEFDPLAQKDDLVKSIAAKPHVAKQIAERDKNAADLLERAKRVNDTIHSSGVN